MNNSLDDSAPQYRWPMMQSRLERTLTDLRQRIEAAAVATGGVVEFGLPQAMTRHGTAYTTYKSGYRTEEGQAPPLSLWENDETLIENWDRIHANLSDDLYEQINALAPCRLSWRITPTIGVHWPPTDEERVAGMYTYNDLPVVWSRFRIALERIEDETE